MKNILYILLFFIYTINVFSQRNAELTVSIGGSVVDIDGIVEIDEIKNTDTEDWGTFSGGVSGQVFPLSAGDWSFGGELMFQHLFWYSVHVPYGTYGLYREYTINTFKFTPIIRYYFTSNIATDIGLEINTMHGTSLGGTISSNYYIPVSDNFSIPIKLRIEVIDYIKPILTVTLNGGLRYNF